MRLLIDVGPMFKQIADYYWDHMDPEFDGSIWDWLRRDYGVIKVGPRGSKRELLIQFPDEAHKTLFLLRWG